MQMRSFLVAALAAGTATAHMNMKDPPPLAYKGNPNAKEPNIDYSITSPITEAQYPCKGYLDLLGTPEGASVATYAPGSQHTMSVEGGASHNGGSCQLSLSYDKGTSFTVIKSFIGNCPTTSGGTYDFTIPSDAPEGDDVVFAWTWVNHTGNREYYMSCAVVTIKAGGARREAPAVNSKRDVAFASRPKVFEANLGGEYCTKEGVDTVFPEPGPDVENTSTSPGPAILCATGADAPEGSTSDSGSGSGSSAGSSAGAGSSSAAATSQAQTATSEAAQQSTTTAASQPSITGGVFLTVPASSGAAATPTTLSTAIVASSGTAAGSSSATTSAATSTAAASSTAVGTPTTSAKVPTTTGGAAGTQVGACTNEGDWACASDGSSFQRCASGQWSAAIPMAAGTKCNPGISNTLSMRRRRDRVRRSGTGFAGF
ncbi:hypothetical protein F4820DRAFT_409011 [Hypoxylon rubiginosum]|uniref:Uncharacterized protein n=1 Tax=Hypoxylon rubiginosum TaxID=110542 RepID=A0ACB9ZAK4_9PEZI|nr:hypothetical protein F4820DRAFT_409011 [Hypoxylon rubiginosum]